MTWWNESSQEKHNLGSSFSVLFSKCKVYIQEVYLMKNTEFAIVTSKNYISRNSGTAFDKGDQCLRYLLGQSQQLKQKDHV